MYICIIIIQFPELCPFQKMIYTVTMTDSVVGTELNILTKTTNYTDKVVMHNVTSSAIKQDTVYSILAHLDTESGNISSSPIYICLKSELYTCI